MTCWCDVFFRKSMQILTFAFKSRSLLVVDKFGFFSPALIRLLRCNGCDRKPLIFHILVFFGLAFIGRFLCFKPSCIRQPFFKISNFREDWCHTHTFDVFGVFVPS